MIKLEWSKLSDNQFEDLCKDILQEDGFQNVQRMSGPGSGDMGQDIIAEEIVATKIGITITFRTLIQCKNYGKSKTTISPKEIEEYANRAETLEYDFLLIMTSSDLSAQAKRIADIISHDKRRRIKINFWTESDLVGRIMQSPRIYGIYFGVPIIRKGKTEIKGQIDENGHIFILAFLVYQGKRVIIRFLVDTGSTVTTILGANALILGLDFNCLERSSIPVQGITGEIQDVYLLKNARIDFVGVTNGKERILEVELSEIHVIKPFGSPTSIHSILGMDVLKSLEISLGRGSLFFLG
jgi:hypothetical protein